MIWQVLYNGLLAGALYGLLALGYTLIYGVARLINFALGDVMMVGAYTAWLLCAVAGWPLGWAAPVATAAALTVSLMVERFATRPASRTMEPLAPVISTIGVSVILQAGVALAFGVQGHGFPPSAVTEGFSVGPGRTTVAQLVALASSAFLAGGLLWFLHAHRFGIAMRAVADDAQLAQTVGIDPQRTIVAAFAVSGALAGFAGVVLALDASLRPTMGYGIGFRAFTAAILGGIGNPIGTMAGALLVGMVSSIAGSYLSSEWPPAYVFGVLVLTLLLRPEGLLPSQLAMSGR